MFQTTLLKMVSEKVSAADRQQLVTLLKGILIYLESPDQMAHSRVVYNDPSVVVRNLVTSIEEADQAKFDDSVLITKAQVTAQSTQRYVDIFLCYTQYSC